MSRYVLKNCAQCGIEMRRHRHAIYCLGCARQRQHIRVAAPDRVRQGNLQRLRINGVFSCLDCWRPVERSFNKGKPCVPPMRCRPCGGLDFRARELVRSRTSYRVQKAIRSGELPHPTTLACVDCQQPATRYDHREYRKPLQVEPVCGSCNVMRGAAIDLSEVVALARGEIIDQHAGPYLATTLRRAAPSLAGGI